MRNIKYLPKRDAVVLFDEFVSGGAGRDGTFGRAKHLDQCYQCDRFSSRFDFPFGFTIDQKSLPCGCFDPRHVALKMALQNERLRLVHHRKEAGPVLRSFVATNVLHNAGEPDDRVFACMGKLKFNRCVSFAKTSCVSNWLIVPADRATVIASC